MRATSRWAGIIALLLGLTLLAGLDRSGAFASAPFQRVSDWSALLWLACGFLLGMAAVTYVLSRRRTSPRGGRPAQAGGDPSVTLRAVLDTSPQAIIGIDSSGNVTMWSPAAATLLGWTPAEVVGRPLPLVVESGAAGARALAYTLRDNRSWGGSAVCIRLNSTVVRAQNVGGGSNDASSGQVDVTYVRDSQAHVVRGAACVLACWNMVIPYLCPEMTDKQKEALSYGVKIPLVYTNVQLRNWTSFEKLKLIH